jgi:hypothetical protein
MLYHQSRIAVLWMALALMVASGGAAAAGTDTTSDTASAINSSSLGSHSPTFVGSAAAGCASGCALLTGPLVSASTASFSLSESAVASPLTESAPSSQSPKVLPSHNRPRLPHGALGPSPLAVSVPPTVSCEPAGRGCDSISRSSGGATGVKGLNAVDSGTILGGDIEPADQGLCAGNGYVIEANNVGEVLVFNTALKRRSFVTPLDTIMGLTRIGWSSGGDISCLYDYNNGGHWFFTEIVSPTSEASGGVFAGCFAGAANSCYEGIAVSVGSNPFGPYNVYFLNANYNPAEPGYPYLLNDFAKISTTRDAFLLFYDEFPLNSSFPGLGGGFFNGAQEIAINKTALELGLPVTDPTFTVAIENMGLLSTPNGTCSSDNTYHLPGITCWYSVIPAQPPEPSQYDNSYGGSGFMLESLDFYGQGDNRFAVFDWIGLKNLNSANCSTCAGIRFGGQLFSGVLSYYDPGLRGAQKSGPIPLGDQCGAAGLSAGTPPPVSCPEGGIASNGDNITQASQAQGRLWGAVSTEIDQTYSSEASPEAHLGAAYWVIDTDTFDRTGVFSLMSQAYVSPKHEDLEMPAMAALSREAHFDGDPGHDRAIIVFTLSGDGGPTGADGGGFYPSTAYGRLTSNSNGLLGSVVNIADLGQSPQDGFTEYAGYPGPTGARWGDYSSAVYLPGSGGRIYFATNYIQFPNCADAVFTLTLGTCGGTRDGFANWGTSVNFVVP